MNAETYPGWLRSRAATVATGRDDGPAAVTERGAALSDTETRHTTCCDGERAARSPVDRRPDSGQGTWSVPS